MSGPVWGRNRGGRTVTGHALRADRLLIRPTHGSQAGTDPLQPDKSQERHPQSEVSQVSGHGRRASASASPEPQTEPTRTLTVRSCDATSARRPTRPRLQFAKLLRPCCWNARPDPAYRGSAGVRRASLCTHAASTPVAIGYFDPAVGMQDLTSLTLVRSVAMCAAATPQARWRAVRPRDHQRRSPDRTPSTVAQTLCPG
jgi:hypothetical protein